jgi:hypothetical protein
MDAQYLGQDGEQSGIGRAFDGWGTQPNSQRSAMRALHLVPWRAQHHMHAEQDGLFALAQKSVHRLPEQDGHNQHAQDLYQHQRDHRGNVEAAQRGHETAQGR